MSTAQLEKMVTFTNGQDFLKLVQIVNEISTELSFFIVDDKIELRNLSLDHVAMVQAKSNTSAIQFNDVDNQGFYLGLKITKNLINDIKKLDLTKGIFIAETGIYDYNGNSIKIELIANRGYQSIPKFNTNKVKLQLSEVREFRYFLELTKKLCSKITLKADDNTFSLVAQTDNFKNELSLVQYPISEIEHIQENKIEKQKFFRQYLDILPKMFPKDLEFLNICFNDQLPVKIEFKVNDIDVIYYIAPLVSN